eukprot:2779289-Amphidinium_carterae.1
MKQRDRFSHVELKGSSVDSCHPAVDVVVVERVVHEVGSEVVVSEQMHAAAHACTDQAGVVGVIE